MSDDEHQEPAPAVEEAEVAPQPPAPVEKPKQLHQTASFAEEDGRTEAQIRMEEEKKKRMAKMEEEMKEYEEMRKEEREKLATEISDLRSKREQRKQERAEEEKRLAELRAVEEQKRRAEEEERQRKKREEEAHRHAEREKKKREAEERMKSQSQRNFTISKKSGGEMGASGTDEAKGAGKTKEQLEAEKKAALEQRIQPLSIDGFSESQLQDKAKELFSKIYALFGDKYDLEQRFKSQNMEMVELTERARQMQKGGQKGQSSKVQTAPDPMSEKLGGIPPKIIMYSQYERVKDHRGFGERQDLFKGPMYGVEYERIKPTSKIVITDQGPRVLAEEGENGEEAHE